MAKKVQSKSATKSSPAVTITAYTDYDKARGYNHCFYQRNESNLFFDVKTAATAKTVNFVLWNIKDPVNPVMAEPPSDWSLP